MLIEQYFSDLASDQKDKFEQLLTIYKDINDKVNLISRKDIVNLEERHVLHSLAIAKVVNFNGSRVLDLGTGGGFPGIPLAIMFPLAKFCLVDSTFKKIEAINEIVSILDIKNAETKWSRVEGINQKFDYVTCRAVGRLDKVWPWAKDKINFSEEKKNGLFYLKGGEIESELPENVVFERWNIKEFYPELPFFEYKSLILLRPKSYY